VSSAVVVAGEALIDLVLARDGSLDGHPGGGPYNVARTIGRLEQPVAYLGRLSTDGFGRRLRDELEADGVSLGNVVETDAPTTLALAELDAAGIARYRFYERGTSAPGLTLAAAEAALPEQVGVFYMSVRWGSCSSRWRRRSRRSRPRWATTRSSRWTRTAARPRSRIRPTTAAGSGSCSPART
jgi:sugar/nucleoside kinase (ribokinase family)